MKAMVVILFLKQCSHKKWGPSVGTYPDPLSQFLVTWARHPRSQQNKREELYGTLLKLASKEHNKNGEYLLQIVVRERMEREFVLAIMDNNVDVLDKIDRMSGMLPFMSVLSGNEKI